jgi:hypothetical protein
MKFNKLKTRRGKLEDALTTELKKQSPDINSILQSIDRYEEDNLDSIEKLRKEKLYDTKRISGALKQTIDAHGPITKLLIGSATKRIYGSFLNNTKPKKYTNLKWLASGMLILSIIEIIVYILIQ